MDHHFKVGASGVSEDFGDQFYTGQRPNGIYIPRFRNLDAKSQQKDYIRGFGYQGSASRDNWARGIKELSHVRRRPQGRPDRARARGASASARGASACRTTRTACR